MRYFKIFKQFRILGNLNNLFKLLLFLNTFVWME